jgi:ATP-binding cassette, subfamily F, member 3
VEWLESFLRTQTLPMIIVSHDREFLDRVCTKIVDTDGGECVSYTGNYSNFLKQKKVRDRVLLVLCCDAMPLAQFPH